MRPVLSFYSQVKDLLSAVEQTGVLQLINQVKPLFATQSRPCAEMMLAAINAGRLELIAGEFLTEQATPTILRPDGTQKHPDYVILATGFSSLPTHERLSQSPNGRCYQVIGTSLSAVHKSAASVAKTIVSSASRHFSDGVVHIR